MFDSVILCSVLPCAAILAWVFHRDRLPEPPRVVTITAILGALSVIPAAGIELALSPILGLAGSPRSIAEAMVLGFVVAALVEESVKLMVLRGYAERHDAFDEPFDGIVYGVAAGMGFAAAENLLYVSSQGTGVGLLRAFTSVPMHAACGVLLGACLGIGKFASRGKAAWTILGLAGAVALHGIYDAFLFSGDFLGDSERPAAGILCAVGALATLALSVGASVLGIARMRRDQERALAAPGTPSPTTELPEPFPSGPPPVPPAPGAPALPMVALLGGVASVACLLVLAAVGAWLASTGRDEPPTPLALLALAALLVGGVGTLTALIVGPLSLVREPRWKPAAIVGVVLAASAAGLLTVGALAPD